LLDELSSEVSSEEPLCVTMESLLDELSD
jgi:hypothetical protein